MAGIPVIDIGRVIEFGLNVTKDFIKWAAWRAFILSVVLITVPIAIYKGWMLVMEKIFEYIGTIPTDAEVWQGTVIQFTGMSAWLADRLRFQECLSVIITVVVLKFALSFIKK